MTNETVDQIAPECSDSVKAAMLRLGNPRQALRRMYKLMESICNQLEKLCREQEALFPSEVPSETNSITPTPVKDRSPFGSSMDVVSEAIRDSSINKTDYSSNRSSNPDFANSNSNFNSNIPSTPTVGTPRKQPDSPFNEVNTQVEAQKKSLHLFESYCLWLDRWEKIFNDFYDPDTEQFELTKVPDAYDMVK